MAQENPTWGYTRIRDALRHVGYDIARNTVKRIKAHLGAVAGADFFTVEVLTLRGLVRYFVFFVIDIQSRRVVIGGSRRRRPSPG